MATKARVCALLLASKEYRPDIWFCSVNGEFPLTYIEVLSNGDLDLTVGESERTLIAYHEEGL